MNVHTQSVLGQLTRMEDALDGRLRALQDALTAQLAALQADAEAERSAWVMPLAVLSVLAATLGAGWVWNFRRVQKLRKD